MGFGLLGGGLHDKNSGDFSGEIFTVILSICKVGPFFISNNTIQ